MMLISQNAKFMCSATNSQNTKSVTFPLLYYVVIYCTLFCFSVARSNLSANIATFVLEMIIFNKGSVFRFISTIKGAKYTFYRV